MSYKIKYTPDALSDLDAAYSGVFEASKDLPTTKRYLQDLIESINDKKDFPLFTPVMDFYGLMTNIHHYTSKAYKIFYRVNSDTIEILRVLIAKSDYIKVLKI